MTALSIEKDFGVPKRKRLIIKSGITDPKAETETETLKVTVKKKIDHHHHHHQDSKAIKNSDYRESVRKLLAEAFSRVSSETDESISSPAFDPVEVAASVEDLQYLRRKVVLGEINAQTLVTMSAEEMASEKRKRENIQIKLKTLKRCVHDANEEDKATTDMFQCSRCRERKCTYYQLQTRSADEPMTTYVTCVKCSKRWKV
ncbi:transcription elongation factor TFIIS-like [Castanea sativa]|uniref:transcription elongation factor TFIIS-like n=1 Tax=Castanea sativa TaxID=21020 RepID=UPI003F64D49B